MNILIGLDQLGNTLFGGAPDETISSRAGRAMHAGHRAGAWLCRALNRLDPGHCDKAVQSERTGTHLPKPLRRPLTRAERRATLDRLKRIKEQE